jgi:hypothetical protein
MTITTENSVKRCAYCPGLLLLPDTKILLLEIEVMTSPPAMDLKQLLGVKSSSFN